MSRSPLVKNGAVISPATLTSYPRWNNRIASARIISPSRPPPYSAILRAPWISCRKFSTCPRSTRLKTAVTSSFIWLLYSLRSFIDFGRLKNVEFLVALCHQNPSFKRFSCNVTPEILRTFIPPHSSEPSCGGDSHQVHSFRKLLLKASGL